MYEMIIKSKKYKQTRDNLLNDNQSRKYKLIKKYIYTFNIFDDH